MASVDRHNVHTYRRYRLLAVKGYKDDCFDDGGGGFGGWILIIVVIFLLFSGGQDGKGGFLDGLFK